MIKKYGFKIVAVIALLLMIASCSKLELAKPENIKYDGATITWNSVENADKYSIQIDGGDVYTVTQNKYPFSTTKESFTVKISANSNASKIIESGQSEVTFIQLKQIKESDFIVDQDGNFSWPVVNEATGYEVKIDGGEIVTTTSTNYKNEHSGSHSFQVRAIVDANSSYWSKWSDAKNINILNTVSKADIKYENGLITWKYVSGAKHYEVRINGKLESDNCNTTQFAFDAENDNFEVSIKAIGNGVTTFNGNDSEVKKFVFLDTITNFQVTDGVITWDEVAGADGYLIKKNDVVQSQVLTTPSYDGLSAGESTRIQIMPISNDSTYFSDWSVVQSITLLPTPVVMWNNDLELNGQANNNLYWNGVNNAKGYTVKIVYPNGKEELKTFGENVRDFAEAYLEIGEYQISVKAEADSASSNYFSSTFSKPFTITRLTAPSAASQNYITSDISDISKGFTVTFEKNAYASKYNLYQDDNFIQETNGSQFAVTELIGKDVLEMQTYNFKIQSVGSYDSSRQEVRLSSLRQQSLSFEITILAVPKNCTISGYQFSYTSVEQATKYLVSRGSGDPIVENTTYHDLSDLQAGSDYNIKVCAMGNGTNVLPSNYSAPIAIHRLDAPTNVRIGTEYEAEGTLIFEPVLNAESYEVVFNGDGNAIKVDTIPNINQYIKEEGTTLYLQSVANCFNKEGTVYYMTSAPSMTYEFIKLAAPRFGDITFSDSELIWNAPNNINTAQYTPTYQVYYDDGIKIYEGEKNGTTMDITYLEGGTSYTFKVKAIGDGQNYINSEMSVSVTIYKLASPKVIKEKGKYIFDSVLNAVSYSIFIDGDLVQTFTHEEGKTYSIEPKFDQIKTYQIEVKAIGDGGYSVISSNPTVIMQKTEQLTTPEFKVGYSESSYSQTGEIIVNITQESKYALGYACSIGGNLGTTETTEYRFTPNSTGTFTVRVYALGGGFDENGVYYIDSQPKGGNSSTSITLLHSVNYAEINVTAGGYLSWPNVENNLGYELEIAINDGEFVNYGTIGKANFVIENFKEITKLKVRVRAVGNGTNIITAAWAEREWTTFGH